MKTEAGQRSDYKYFHPITTRWMDNDACVHVNKVVYYGWFDTVVYQFLIANGALDIKHDPVIGLVIETQCNYFASVACPDPVTAGLRVTKLDNSSVRYDVRGRHLSRRRSACLGPTTLHPCRSRHSQAEPDTRRRASVSANY
jgi:acyl-CoA thioester hydrolase